MEHAPAGTEMQDPFARRPRAPAINLAAHDVRVREEEHTPQVKLFETGGNPTMDRNKPVLDHLEPQERKAYEEAIATLQALYQKARERYAFTEGQAQKASQDARGAVETPHGEPEATRSLQAKPRGKQAAKQAKPAPAKAAAKLKAIKPGDMPTFPDDDEDSPQLNESAVNAAFAATLQKP